MRDLDKKLCQLILLLSVLYPGTGFGQSQQLREIQTIVIDPGHGGHNEGAVGVSTVFERFLTLDTALKLEKRLSESFPHLNVILTRRDDIDLSLNARTHHANLVDADLFISIHYNAAYNPFAEGIETFYLSSEATRGESLYLEDEVQGPSGLIVNSILRDLERNRLSHQSAAFAEIMQAALLESSGAANREVRQAPFAVLRGAEMPSIVTELGFLTNKEECDRIMDLDYRAQLVDGLYNGIVAFDAWIAAESIASVD